MKCDHITFVQTKQYIKGTKRTKKLRAPKQAFIGGFPNVRKNVTIRVAGKDVSYIQLMKWVSGKEKHPLGHFEQCQAEVRASITFYTYGGCSCCSSSDVEMDFTLECEKGHLCYLNPYPYVNQYDIDKFVNGEIQPLPEIDRKEAEQQWLTANGY